MVTKGLNDICGPWHLIPLPKWFSIVLPCNTCVAKFDTLPGAEADGAAVFEVLAKAGLPNNNPIIVRKL